MNTLHVFEFQGWWIRVLRTPDGNIWLDVYEVRDIIQDAMVYRENGIEVDYEAVYAVMDELRKNEELTQRFAWPLTLQVDGLARAHRTYSVFIELNKAIEFYRERSQGWPKGTMTDDFFNWLESTVKPFFANVPVEAQGYSDGGRN